MLISPLEMFIFYVYTRNLIISNNLHLFKSRKNHNIRNYLNFIDLFPYSNISILRNTIFMMMLANNSLVLSNTRV